MAVTREILKEMNIKRNLSIHHCVKKQASFKEPVAIILIRNDVGLILGAKTRTSARSLRDKLQEDKTKMERSSDTSNFRDLEINEGKLRRAFLEETRKLQKNSDKYIKRFCEQEIELKNKKRRLDSQSEELNKREEFLERERQKLEEEKQKMESSSDNNLRDAEINEYKEKLRRAFLEETRKLQKISDERIKKFCEQEIELENKKLRLDSQNEELNKREKFLECESQKLEEEKRKFVQRKANENSRRQAKATEEYQRGVEEAKREEEEILEREWGLQYEKQMLGYFEIRAMPKIWQEAFKNLMAGFCNLLTSCGSNIIGIQKMGEIDEESFGGCIQKLQVEGAKIEAFELCSLWQTKLKHPKWNPFKIAVNKHGNAKILINEDDDLLRGLKDWWGDEVYDNAVITALKELQLHKLSRFYYGFPLLWNFTTNREATIKEVITYIIIQLKTLKRNTP